MKKFLALAIIAPLLISCSSSNKNGETYNEAWVKDTNGFDILMGQFAHNIENLWGFSEVLIAGPKDYVKYTDQYQTRSHINFDEGTITVETISGTDPTAHLRQAIIKTLLMGDDPGSIDLYSDADDIQISKEPFLYGQVVDNTGQPIRWMGRATSFADYLLKTRLQKRSVGLKIIYSVTFNLVPNHLDKRWPESPVRLSPRARLKILFQVAWQISFLWQVNRAPESKECKSACETLIFAHWFQNFCRQNMCSARRANPVHRVAATCSIRKAISIPARLTWRCSIMSIFPG